MSKLLNSGGDEAEFAKPLYVPIKRRSFFMYAGATAGATALLLSGCNDDDDNNNSAPNAVDVGSGDVGVLNYAYGLEQLEAAFYAHVKTGKYYASASAAEKAIFDDIAAHELIHREFFKAALGTGAIKSLEVDFTGVNIDDRATVLTAAKTFEDLGVSAYNGAGQFITSPDYLTLAGKIVSVEARHAALIRDLISNGTFVGNDVVSPTTGLEISKSPTEVAAAANTYLKDGSKLNVSNIK
jgi:hypothetical protein